MAHVLDTKLPKRQVRLYGPLSGLSSASFIGKIQSRNPFIDNLARQRLLAAERWNRGANMANQYDVLVVGSGLAGSTAARLLAERGKSVLVLEQKNHIGGNCYDEKTPDGITRHLYGPHLFHTNNQAVWNFVNRFSSFRLYQHRVLTYVDGQMLPFPINRDTICQLYGVNLSVREVETFLADEVARSIFNQPPLNFRDAVVAQVGEYLYAKFFENYTRKQWDVDPVELSAEIAGRIPVRFNRDNRYFTDQYQGVPEIGYTGLIDGMLNHPLIDVRLETDFLTEKERFEREGQFGLTVYTGKLDDYFDQIYGALNYRSVRFEFKTLPIERYQPAAVVNYPNDYDFTRISEFKQMSGEVSPSTEICLEYPAKDGVPSYVVLNQENIGRRQAYLDHVKELEEAGKIVFIGRLAEYRYYNMDQVVASVMSKLADRLN
jgi:UDP-galactopyranose mutase